ADRLCGPGAAVGLSYRRGDGHRRRPAPKSGEIGHGRIVASDAVTQPFKNLLEWLSWKAAIAPWFGTASTSRASLLFIHDLFGNPRRTFPDHAGEDGRFDDL